jgi:hypothetical protein
MNINRRKSSRFFFSARNYGSACPKKQPGGSSICVHTCGVSCFFLLHYICWIWLFFERAASLPIRRRRPLCSVFLIATRRLRLPAAGGGGAQVAGPGNRGSPSSRVFFGTYPHGAQKGGSYAIIASRMMIIAKRGKATRTSYSTAGRALAESIRNSFQIWTWNKLQTNRKAFQPQLGPIFSFQPIEPSKPICATLFMPPPFFFFQPVTTEFRRCTTVFEIPF